VEDHGHLRHHCRRLLPDERAGVDPAEPMPVPARR
jgi:hypothetical protein